MHNFFLLICLILLIYFLRTPLHGLAFHNFTYPLSLFPSYLNHAFVYFNQISVTIYLVYTHKHTYRCPHRKNLRNQMQAAGWRSPGLIIGIHMVDFAGLVTYVEIYFISRVWPFV